MTKTVEFDVGGKVYKVSRALVEDQHNESMLARLVSERWRRKNNNEPIFIDRDGEIFRFVLEYMRHGEVELPPLVPASNFFRDLDYYGIPVIDESSVVSLSPTSLIQRRQELVKGIRAMQVELAMIYGANAFSSNYLQMLNIPASAPVVVEIEIPFDVHMGMERSDLSRHTICEVLLNMTTEGKEDFDRMLTVFGIRLSPGSDITKSKSFLRAELLPF